MISLYFKGEKVSPRAQAGWTKIEVDILPSKPLLGDHQRARLVYRNNALAYEIYHTPVTINQAIRSLKEQLAAVDYKSIKYLQGSLPDAEWQSTKVFCEQVRAQINALEELL